MASLLDYLGGKKIPLGFAVAVVMALVWMKGWAEVNFVTTAKAEASISALTGKVDANGAMLKQHIGKYEKNENKKAILLKQDQQFDLRQYVAANGENSMTQARAEELRRELVDLQDTKNCLQSGRGNCQ